MRARQKATLEFLRVVDGQEQELPVGCDGVVRLFPACTKDLVVRFEKWRAEGAFLVTAAWKNGAVTELAIESEKGGPCRFAAPGLTSPCFVDPACRPVAVLAEADGVFCLETAAGGRYTLAPSYPACASPDRFRATGGAAQLAGMRAVWFRARARSA